MSQHMLWLEECQKIIFFPKLRTFEQGTRTSEEAAYQLGCNICNIAKSIIFEGKNGAIVVITSGINRVDKEKKLKNLLGYKPSRASNEYVRNNTGFKVGGVPPFGHLNDVICIIDEDLLRYDIVWGAGGTSKSVLILLQIY